MEILDESKHKKIALLIDGDNAQPSLISQILAETGKYGSVTIRRIYGDWTKANMSGWKDTLNNYAIQPIQQFRYTIGKNATDSAMIIDAMDILHGGMVEGFCIVSSDSDYTRLATRIRETGIFVMGIGKSTTPKAFVNACNVFIYTENLVTETKSVEKKQKEKTLKDRPKVVEKNDPIQLLTKAIEMAMQEDGWANLATAGFYLHQLDPGFDPRSYGHKQLSSLFKSFPEKFELKFQSDAGITTIFVRMKD